MVLKPGLIVDHNTLGKWRVKTRFLEPTNKVALGYRKMTVRSFIVLSQGVWPSSFTLAVTSLMC